MAVGQTIHKKNKEKIIQCGTCGLQTPTSSRNIFQLKSLQLLSTSELVRDLKIHEIKMTSIVRIKRRQSQEPAEALLLQAKRLRVDESSSVTTQDNVFRFCGTTKNEVS